MEKLEEKLLTRALKLGVVSRGKFKLASGRTSNYYIDGRLLGLDSQGAKLIGQIVNQRLAEEVSSVGGPATGAITLVAATLATCQRQPGLSGFYTRPSAKDHGHLKSIDGQPRNKALILDDVCTTGGSLLQTADQLKSEKIEIDSIMTIFDRIEQGGGDNIIQKGYKYSAIFTVSADGEIGLYEK